MIAAGAALSEVKEHGGVTSAYITGSVVEGAVGLVLVRAGERSNAMTISFFSEVAHHPTSLWIAVAKSSFTHALLAETGRFSLAVLNQSQGALALSCGTVSGRDRDKCSLLDLYLTTNGSLFLRGALASTACTIRRSTEVGDHTLYIADIIESHLDSRKAHLRHLLVSDLENL